MLALARRLETDCCAEVSTADADAAALERMDVAETLAVESAPAVLVTLLSLTWVSGVSCARVRIGDIVVKARRNREEIEGRIAAGIDW